MDDMTLWTVMHEALMRVFAMIQEPAQQWQAETAITHFPGILLGLIGALDPEPVKLEDLLPVCPYTHPDVPGGLLEKTVESGYLEKPTPETYRMTEKGRTEMKRGAGLAAARMMRDDPSSESEGARLAKLMKRLLDAILRQTPPPEAWYAGLVTRDMAPAENRLPYVFGCISGVLCYRSDAHVAAWRASGIEGVEMDTITMVAAGVRSPSDAQKQMVHRGYAVYRYEQAFDWLRGRGCIEGPPDSAVLSVKGKELRQGIEDQTDAYFFAPWLCLTEDEKLEMSNLLEKLRTNPPRRS